MENAADALKMAAAFLIFIMALAISINAFSQARLTATTLLEYHDRDYDYRYIEANVDDSGNPVTERIVGIESVVPSIYKAWKENYKIVFDDGILSDGVYQQEDETGSLQVVNTIDLEDIALASNREEPFVMAILYGNKCENFSAIKTYFRKNMGINLNENGIYDKISNRKLKESIGIYYQDEISEDGAVTPAPGEDDTSNVPEANKIEKRVITYSII